MRPAINQFYDEDKIFPNNYNNNNIIDDNNNYMDNNPYPYQNREYSPDDNNSRKSPYGNTAMDGFRRPYINPDNNNNINNLNNRMNNSMNIRSSPF